MKLKQNSCFKKKLVKIKKNWVVVSILGMVLLSTAPLSAAASIQNMQIVHNQLELENALKNKDINSIKLANDIDIDKDFINYQLPKRELSIDLDYHRLNSPDEVLNFMTTGRWGNDEKLNIDFQNKQFSSNNKENNVNSSLSSENITQSVSDVNTSSTKSSSGDRPSLIWQNSEHDNSVINLSSAANSNSSAQSSAFITSNQSNQSSFVDSVAPSATSNINNVQSTASSTASTNSNSDQPHSSVSNASSVLNSNETVSTGIKVKPSNEITSSSSFYNDSQGNSASSQSMNMIKNLLAQNTTNDLKIISINNQLNQLKNELALKEQQLDVLKKSNENKGGLINVHPHRIKVDKKCYVYQEMTFNKKQRLRVADNKDIANQLVTQHAYSSEGRLRYKVSGGYITAHPDYVKLVPINK